MDVLALTLLLLCTCNLIRSQVALSANDSSIPAQVHSKIAGISQLPSQLLQTQMFPGNIFDLNMAPITAGQLVLQCGDFAPGRVAPPPSPTGTVTNITPAFGIDRLLGISTIDETMSVSATLLLTWQVKTCPSSSQGTTSQSSGSLSQLYAYSPKEVWTPGFRYVSAATSNIYMQDSSDFGEDIIVTMETVASNLTLTFYWVKDGAFTSACSLDLTKFPFDSQTCLFSFSLMRSTQVVQFQAPVLIWPSGFDHEEWNFQDQAFSLSSMRYKGQLVSTVYYMVTLSRRPTYYIINLVLPTCVLVVVEICSFVLPSKEINRASISVTVLLAVTLSQSTVIAQLPKTSKHILLADYTFYMALICAVCSLEQMVVCFVAAKVNERNLRSDHNGHRDSKAGANSNCFKRVGIARWCDLVCAVFASLAFIALNVYALVTVQSN